MFKLDDEAKIFKRYFKRQIQSRKASSLMYNKIVNN